MQLLFAFCLAFFGLSRNLASSVIIAFIRPQHTLGDAPIVMVKGSGALYVRLGDTLHPVVNLASARLIVGTRPVHGELERANGEDAGAAHETVITAPCS